MRSKLMVALLGVVMSMMIATAGFAEDVVVTKSGKKYHHVDSRFSKTKGAEVISIEEAVERGLEPSKDYLRRKSQDSKADGEK